MSEWKETELGEISEVQTGPFGSQLKNEQYITGGTPVITVEHIQDFKIKDFNYPSVTEEDKIRLSKYLLKTGDIIFTRVGSVDLSAYVKPNQDGWMFSSRMLRVRPDKNEIDSRFLSYYFQQPKFREYILNISVGATMPSINTGILKGIPISYPFLPEQQAIANILSSLDDKIDLLYRQNATLEAMAETLFRQWFVEEAKEDWEEFQVSDIAGHLKTNVIPSKQPSTFFHHYSLPAFDASQNPVTEMGIEILSNKYKVFPESILVSKLNPRSPRIWAIGTDVKDNSICSTEFQVFKPRDKNVFAYLFFLLKSDDAKNILSMSASGTSGSHQRVRPEDISNIPFALPNIDLAIEFSKITQPFLNKINQNQAQIRTLTALRDTLLPKLMSGEVRVEM